MAIIPPPPENVWDCPILAALRDKSRTESAGTIDKANVFLETATPLIEIIISGPFRQYTLHNPGHSKKILHLASQLLPTDTLARLSPLEHLIILYSAYLHDMGMCLTDVERQRILSSEEFLD